MTECRLELADNLERILISNSHLSDFERCTIKRAADILAHRDKAILMTFDDIARAYAQNYPVWLEILHADENLLIPTTIESLRYIRVDSDHYRRHSVAFSSGNVQMVDLLGKQWRCWDTEPSKEQRSRPWEALQKEEE